MAAMGLDAWKRPATAEERKVMASMLDDALANGALGLSTNLLDHDGENRPIPTLVADDDEFSALFDVLDRYPNSTFQCIIGKAYLCETCSVTISSLRSARSRVPSTSSRP